jgi:GPH family glycoside/pentoside/hexuronide:cation symporter
MAAQETTTSTPTVARDRLPIPTKVAYGLGTALDMWGFWLYPGVAFAVFNIYLGVDPALVGLALGLIRIYDAVADPVAGWISDNFRSKSGRRRPFILVAGVLSGLGLPFLFAVSPSWADKSFLGASLVFWYMIGSSLIFIPIISTFSVPFNSLGAEMSPDYDERTSIMTYKGAMQKVFEVGNFYALKFTNLAWFLLPGGGKNTLLGVQVYTSILGIVMAAFAITIFFRVPERYYDRLVAEKQAPLSIASSLYATLKCRPFRIIMGMGGAFSLSTSMVGSLGYYTTVYYVCSGNTINGDSWNFWMGLAFMIGGFLGAPLLNRVAAAIGKRNAVVVAASIGIVGYGGSWFLYTPLIPWLQTLASGTMGMAAAGLWMLHGSIGADVIDYDELEMGTRREGSFTACGSYLLKLGNSAGQFVSGVILAWAGFNAAVAIQTARTIFWIRFMLASIPVAGLIVAIIIILRLDLTKERCAEIRQALERRRGTV